MAQQHNDGVTVSGSRQIPILEKPIVDGVRKESKVQDQLKKEIPLVTEAQKYIDHDRVVPSIIPKPIASEIIQKEIKLNETKKQELLTVANEQELKEEKMKDQNQQKLQMTTLKQEVDEELDDFPIILDGGSKSE